MPELSCGRLRQGSEGKEQACNQGEANAAKDHQCGIAPDDFKFIFKYKMADGPAAQKPRAKGYAGGQRSDHGRAQGE